MTIWFKPVTLDDCAKMDTGINGKGTLMQTMGIKISEIGDDYLKATMPASPKIHNPLGIVHGGANVVLAETVASYAANFVVNYEQYYCVGQEIANHLKSTRDGLLTAITTPVHIGERSSVWRY